MFLIHIEDRSAQRHTHWLNKINGCVFGLVISCRRLLQEAFPNRLSRVQAQGPVIQCRRNSALNRIVNILDAIGRKDHDPSIVFKFVSVQ